MNTTRMTLTIAGALGVAAWAAAPLATAGPERGESIRIAAPQAPAASGGGWTRKPQGATRSETTSRIDDTEVKVISEDGATRIFVNGNEVAIDPASGSWTDEASGVRVERRGGRMIVTRGGGQIMSFSDDGSNVFTGDRMRLWREGSDRMRGLAELRGVPGAPGMPGGAEAPTPPPVMLGVTLEPLDESGDLDIQHAEGATVIRRVFKGLPADKAGLHEMDVIVEIDGSSHADPDALRQALAEKKPGQTLSLKVLRDGAPQDVVIELAPYDAEKIGAPRAWGWNSGGDSFFSDEGRKRLEELQKILADSSGEMLRLHEQMLGKSGKDSEQFARQMAELAAKMSAQSAELARQSAELSVPDVSRFFLEREGQGPRAFGFPGGAPLRFRTNPDGSQAIIVAPDAPEVPGTPDEPEAPDAQGRRGGSTQRMDALNARLDRLERLLEKLIEQGAAAPKN